MLMVLIFVIWLPAGSKNHPKTNDSSDVWLTFENGTEWPYGWAFIMGKHIQPKRSELVR